MSVSLIDGHIDPDKNEMTIKLADSIKKAKSNMRGREFSCELERNFFFAEQLIESGVIVPPCKVGETVYYVHETYWDENYKDYIKTEKLKQGVLQVVYSPKLKTNLMLEVKEFDWDLFNSWLNGKIFLTKSEAEQKLKEMRGGNDL